MNLTEFSNKTTTACVSHLSLFVFAVLCLPESSLGAGLCRDPAANESVISLASRNFSLLESDANGYYRLVENIDISQSRIDFPMYSGTSFSGVLSGNGFNISHLDINTSVSKKAALFGIIDHSCIDIVVDSPVAFGGDSAIVAVEAANHNAISASIVKANLQGNRTSGLLAALVSGEANRFTLYNASGTVTVLCNYRNNCNPNNDYMAAGLGVGEVTGSLELSQINVQGGVSVVADDSPDRSSNDIGAALGVGLSSGEIKLEQQQVWGDVVSYCNVPAPSFGRIDNAAGLGIGVGSGNIVQQNVRGNVNAYAGTSVIDVNHYAGLGIGTAGESTFRLSQFNVSGNVSATTGSGYSFAALGVANADYDSDHSVGSVLQRGVSGDVSSMCPSTYGGRGAFGALGVAHNGRDVLTLDQVAVRGTVRGPARQTQVNLGTAVGAIVSWDTDYGSASATLKMFSGGEPELSACSTGHESAEGLVDIASYRSKVIDTVRKLNSTYPQDWRVCHKTLCDLHDCEHTSCHYVHERLQGLIAQGDHVFLLTRQHHPFGDYTNEKNGIFRITRFNGNTIPLKTDTENFGKKGYLLYPAPINDKIIPAGLLPSLLTINQKHLLALYAPQHGTIQLASFPLNNHDDAHYYQLSNYKLEGQPVLLSDSGYGSVWLKGNDSRLFRYDMEADGHLNTTAVEYDLSKSAFPASPLVALGCDDKQLYTAREVAVQNKVALERLDTESCRFDPDWQADLNETLDDNIDYRLITKGKLIALLPKGSVPLLSGKFGVISGVGVSLPEYGGCAAWSESSYDANYTAPAVPMIPINSATTSSADPSNKPAGVSLSEQDIVIISAASGVAVVGVLLFVSTTVSCLIYRKSYRRTYQSIQ